MFPTGIQKGIAASMALGKIRTQRCPNCGQAGLSSFYEVKNVPVHSCLLMPSRKEASEYPTGDVKLGFCQACGFISNVSFDPGVHEYSQRYEETQGFSPTFNAFARSLAQRLVDKYDLHGKDILEIGCGKGEFLALMCELGKNRGIGIDPAYVPQRLSSEAAHRITFFQDFYSQKYAHLAADVIVCRHTLEHIAPTGEFLRTLRQTIGDRTETLVFFELPDTMRILKEGAFWDIYYEHCSYFTAGSLARLFRAAGFDVLDLQLDYDKQYILLTAKPAQGPTEPRLELENDLQEVTAAVDNFKTTCKQRLDLWHDSIEDFTSRKQKAVIWGSGSKGVAFLTTLGLGDQIEYVVDINPYKHGKYMPRTAQMIVPPEYLVEYRPDHVIIMNPVYVPEIERQMDELGLQAWLLPV